MLLSLCVVALVSCASLSSDFIVEPSYTILANNETILSVKVRAILGDKLNQSALMLISEGTDALLSCLFLLS